MRPARRPPILFQTNGIEIGRGRVILGELALAPKQLYLFEVSFKGTSPAEFALLTGKNPDLYELQLAGYRRFLTFSRVNNNVAVAAVLGVYHSATRGPSRYAFVDHDTGAMLFDNRRKWHPEFTAIWTAAPLKWVERLRMSPRGLWKNVWARCGPQAAGIIAYFPQGASTNPYGLFPGKPLPAEYARKIVQMHFWPISLTRTLPKWEQTEPHQPVAMIEWLRARSRFRRPGSFGRAASSRWQTDPSTRSALTFRCEVPSALPCWAGGLVM